MQRAEIRIRTAVTALMIGCAIVVLWVAQSSGEVPSQRDALGPFGFVRLVTIGLLALLVFSVVSDFWKYRAALLSDQAFASPDARGSEDIAEGLAYFRAVSAVILILAYMGAMRYVGYIPATIAFQVLVLAAVFSVRSPVILVATPLILTAIYTFLFLRLMQMPLPHGQGPFRYLHQVIAYF